MSRHPSIGADDQPCVQSAGRERMVTSFALVSGHRAKTNRSIIIRKTNWSRVNKKKTLTAGQWTLHGTLAHTIRAQAAQSMHKYFLPSLIRACPLCFTISFCSLIECIVRMFVETDTDVCGYWRHYFTDLARYYSCSMDLLLFILIKRP